MSDKLEGRLLQGLADRYQIERELGQGGMATVFLAQDLRHDRRVAVVLTGDFVRDINRPAWDISPDGNRFVFMKDSQSSETREMNVVINWFDQFRKR